MRPAHENARCLEPRLHTLATQRDYNVIMAPSRGLNALRRSISNFTYSSTRSYSKLAQFAIDPARRTQIYISRTLDPYINLSIEHFLLQKSPPDSTVLFLYTNEPCIVIGRNQNPWVEVNLGLLKDGIQAPGQSEHRKISLVRRRSGGGTVFHDEGNVNYSVICPTSAFDRDKHAQMVVRALNRLGVKEARVNERHDIVLGLKGKDLDTKPFKVSGSAYKLTRLRSLHHGTCLLSSPNIRNISQYLRSPAKPYIKARGVDSVNSPISNVNVPNEAFEQAVAAEFGKMYEHQEPVILTEEASKVPDIAKGLAELKSLDWTYLQTPQFTFSSHITEDDPRERPPLPGWVSPLVSPTFPNAAMIKD
jgi:lipoate-protein ligase A